MSNMRDINKLWVPYDKYDRRTWPQIQDGSREAFAEKDDGTIHISSFYNNGDDGPNWSSRYIEEGDVVVRYADIEAFKYIEELE